MLNDSSLSRVYLIVDALDECDSGLDELLELITNKKLNLLSRVKWLMASRNRLDIEERLRSNSSCLKISLKLNSSYISCTIDTFIDFKVQELAEQKKYDSKLWEEVRSYLYENAEGTFL